VLPVLLSFIFFYRDIAGLSPGVCGERVAAGRGKARTFSHFSAPANRSGELLYRLSAHRLIISVSEFVDLEGNAHRRPKLPGRISPVIEGQPWRRS